MARTIGETTKHMLAALKALGPARAPQIAVKATELAGYPIGKLQVANALWKQERQGRVVKKQYGLYEIATKGETDNPCVVPVVLSNGAWEDKAQGAFK